MANLFFPQLTSGAVAQYPIRKTKTFRTVTNQMMDGNTLQFADGTGSHMLWTLEYAELDSVDIQQLKAHFTGCVGPFRGFTFIDPSDNMLSWSGDLTNSVWTVSPSVSIAANAADPDGGSSAWALTNNSQISTGVKQTLTVPANYQYCFSTYVRSSQGATVTLVRTGLNDQAPQVFTAGNGWTRIVSSGRLNDSGINLSVQISVEPGQEVDIHGPQLEAQVAPSRYRSTSEQGGIYANAHWSMNSFPVIATGPGQFATTISIESTL